MSSRPRQWIWILWVCGALGCERGAAPSPSTPGSFLAGTWRGTVTIQANPGLPGLADPLAGTSGPSRWTFDVVPETNRQTFRASVTSEHPWLPITTVGSTAIVLENGSRVLISTQGGYDSPRGCRGTYGSVGYAEATRIEANFSGVDCDYVVFSGSVTLTKE